LNEDLVETIALAHDLGHTPFGHAGQDALNVCMAPFGGFEHNLQSLRVVDHLEERYPAFDGLNLCFETREGILKHCSSHNAALLEADEAPFADGQGGVGQRFLNRTQPSLEAQLCNLADEIAYNAHDIDDGVRSGLITLEQLQEVPLFDGFRQQALAAHAHLGDSTQSRRLLYESIRLMLSAQVYDVISATQRALDSADLHSVGSVRAAAPLIAFSAEMRESSQLLKTFLLRKLYRHPQVVQTMDLAKQVVRDLFDAYSMAPHEMQAGYASRFSAASMRVVADYIAGMTDRFAAREHERLTGRKLLQGQPGAFV
jgi:dGTPase